MRSLLRSLPVGAGTWLLLSAGCTATRTVQRADLSPPNPQTRVWVTRADHTTVILDSARVRADTIIGMDQDGQPQRLPLTETTALRVCAPSPDRTAGLVFLGAAGVLTLAVYLVDKTPSGPVPCHAICGVSAGPCPPGSC